jgi:hypothetical protein
MGYISFRRDIYRILGAIEFTVVAARAFLRILDDRLVAFLIHPYHIHGTAIDAYPAAVA